VAKRRSIIQIQPQPRFEDTDTSVFDGWLESVLKTGKRSVNTAADFFLGGTPEEQAQIGLESIFGMASPVGMAVENFTPALMRRLTKRSTGPKDKKVSAEIRRIFSELGDFGYDEWEAPAVRGAILKDPKWRENWDIRGFEPEADAIDVWRNWRQLNPNWAPPDPLKAAWEEIKKNILSAKRAEDLAKKAATDLEAKTRRQAMGVVRRKPNSPQWPSIDRWKNIIEDYRK